MVLKQWKYKVGLYVAFTQKDDLESMRLYIFLRYKYLRDNKRTFKLINT